MVPTRFGRSPVVLAALIVAALGCASAPVFARSGGLLTDYTVRTWNENDGLPAGRIRALVQDPDGYLWLATDAGLVRFDGARFEGWNTIGQDRLPVGAVTALLSGRDGSLWVGVGGRLPVGRIRDGHLTLYGSGEGFGGSYVLSLLEDRAGSIWAGTFQGLFQFMDGRWHRVGPEQGLGEGSVLAIYEDTRGRMWAATSRAIYRRDAGHPRFEHVDAIDISSNVWQSFSEDAAGAVWISDFKEGFRRPSGAAPRTPGQRRGWGVELLHDSRDNFWVGTQGQGLWRVRGRGSSAPGIGVITVDHGLASNAVQSLLEDREGNIWVGTVAGLQRLTPHRVQPVKNLPIPRAIEVTRDGSVWVGTAGGLVRFTAAGRRDYTEADGVQGSVVLALHADDRGDLWISTERGVSRFSGERFSPLLAAPGDRMQRILGITGSGDTLWMRDFHQRLFRWKDGQAVPADDVPERHRRAASSIYAGRSGSLWIGSTGGRIGVRDASGAFRSFVLDIGNIGCIFEDSTRTVWVGGDDGLARIADDGRALTIGRPNGLAGSIKAITEDSLGAIWIGTDSGILRIERAEFDRVGDDPAHHLRYRLFNTTDGAAGVPYSEGSTSALRAPDGRLWFVASSGVTIVDPAVLGDTPAAPPVRIESVTADARVLDPSSAISLTASTSHLLIGFTALSLSDPARVRFRYRLDGFDRDWVDAGGARQASYTNLPPREYRFQVVASGGDGTWGSPALLAFEIEPMFYQTRWFYAVVGLAVFAIVYASWRLHVRQVRRQFALVLAERIRMSRAIHDTLLQGLAAMALQVDDLSHDPDLASAAGRGRILRVRRQAEDYIRQARQSILDLRSPSLASHDLPQALRAAAERAIGSRVVELDVTVKGAPHDAPPVVEEQLLLIGQEAVNNAVQHGGARRVAVELDYGQQRTRLRVTDDGCGFDPETAQAMSGHYGLISMRERAQQVRGQLTISSAPGSGTEIETIVPL